ncbi:MAG: hypothetical protein ACSW8I_08900, partial [bacterium]
AFATAPAHTIRIVDTLDATVFDLASFSASSFCIGKHKVDIKGGQSFIRTVDMRPDIDLIAEVRLNFSKSTGVAEWVFRSLNPATLQTETNPMVGILPVNTDGSGVGDVCFNINRKRRLQDSTLIDNHASIIFDNEAPIATPVWRNIMDVKPPVSIIDSMTFVDDTVYLTMAATDNLSGVWRYHVYGMRDSIWYPLISDIEADSVAVFVLDSTFQGYRTIAVDSAGNAESLLPPAPTVYDTVRIDLCDNIVWFDSVYTVTGNYQHSLHGLLAGDADTLLTLMATVRHSTSKVVDTAVCENFEWHGTVFNASTNTPTFDTVNAMGCDSVTHLHLIVNTATAGDTSATACDGFTWRDGNHDASGNFPYTLVGGNAHGCDSTVTLHLIVNTATAGDTSATACDGFTWRDGNHDASGNFPYTLVGGNAHGCD